MNTTGRDQLLEQVRALPDRPGVYVFRDGRGATLYAGKAKSLRSRVRSYFGAGVDRSVLVQDMAKRIHGLETFVVESEAEALLLEWNLIRQHHPRYNVQLRDDKSYPYIKVTTREPFPRVFVTRRLRTDGSRYFGPYTDVGSMRRALRAIKRIFTVRSCNYDMPRQLPDRPCLDYHIGRCKAPCAGLQTEAEYGEMIDEILHVLGGHTSKVRRGLEEKMEEASEALDFERAAGVRDVLRGVAAIERRQTAIDFRGGDYDVIGIEADAGLACGVVLRVREGRLIAREVHFLRYIEGESLAEMVAALVKAFYLRRDDLPVELLVPCDFEDRELIEEHLAEKRGKRMTVRVPQRGHKRRMTRLAEENARHELQQERLRTRVPASADLAADASTVPVASSVLQEALGLAEPPRTILCFDVSTLAGAESVGSAVWLSDGSPNKNEYRRFRIRHTPDGSVDDYAMMQEIVGRYFGRRVREEGELPHLVVIDGGIGQLRAARQAMESAGVSDVPAVGLAKREEEIYTSDGGRPVRLREGDPGLRWLQAARDEAHRFAVSYNRALRKDRTLHSKLAEIPGIGPAKEKELLRRFGSLAGVRGATPEQLRAVPGIGRATAARIRDALVRENGS